VQVAAKFGSLRLHCGSYITSIIFFSRPPARFFCYHLFCTPVRKYTQNSSI